MCGRFTQSYTWRELVELYRLTVPARNLQPRYNIAPTTTIDVLRLAETGPELAVALQLNRGRQFRRKHERGRGGTCLTKRDGRAPAMTLDRL
jgi:putative SOS response-associated peptidase YedK